MAAKNEPMTTEQMKSSVYKYHNGYYSDFEGANGQCANCGVPIYNAPDIHEAHDVQMLYHSEQGDVYCEACFFDSYDYDGHHIAQPEMVTVYAVRIGAKTRYFENWQAASGYARREEDAEYLGEREMERAMLEEL